MRPRSHSPPQKKINKKKIRAKCEPPRLEPAVADDIMQTLEPGNAPSVISSIPRATRLLHRVRWVPGALESRRKLKNTVFTRPSPSNPVSQAAGRCQAKEPRLQAIDSSLQGEATATPVSALRPGGIHLDQGPGARNRIIIPI